MIIHLYMGQSITSNGMMDTIMKTSASINPRRNKSMHAKESKMQIEYYDNVCDALVAQEAAEMQGDIAMVVHHQGMFEVHICCDESKLANAQARYAYEAIKP